MHPSNDADALLVVIGSLHYGFDFLTGISRTFIDNFYGNVACSVQACHHFFTVTVNCNDCITSIEQLRTSHPPNL